jgi:hypothetical protein
MDEQRSEYGHLYRDLKLGHRMCVTEEEGLLIVRFEIVSFKGQKVRVLAIGRHGYIIDHQTEQNS